MFFIHLRQTRYQRVRNLRHHFPCHIRMHRQAQYRLAKPLRHRTIRFCAIRTCKRPLLMHRFPIIYHRRDIRLLQLVLQFCSINLFWQLHRILRPTAHKTFGNLRQDQFRICKTFIVPRRRLVHRIEFCSYKEIRSTRIFVISVHIPQKHIYNIWRAHPFNIDFCQSTFKISPQIINF